MFTFRGLFKCTSQNGSADHAILPDGTGTPTEPGHTGRYAQGGAQVLWAHDGGPGNAGGPGMYTDPTGRYTLFLNGRLFRSKLHREVPSHGKEPAVPTGPALLLEAFAQRGISCLHDLNGPFALAIHDAKEDRLLLARDHFGECSLYWTLSDGCFTFSSGTGTYPPPIARQRVDAYSLRQYLAFHYTPAPHSILEDANKLLPGHVISVSAQGMEITRWYNLATASLPPPTTGDPKRRLHELLEEAVSRRLDPEGPMGAFLSGGVDSSIISALAAKQHKHLHTFSIGFPENSFFDESRHAEEVARHIGSTHETFRLGREELAEGYLQLLESLDEPYADSSALAAFILCRRARSTVKAALSGDGADEVFGGYRKHQAELRWRNPGIQERGVRLLAPLWSVLPRSRNSAWQDRFRQLDRFARMAGKDPVERFLQLAAFLPRDEAEALVSGPFNPEVIRNREKDLTTALAEMPGMNGVLLADVSVTLPNDMFRKTEVSGGANGLEVRAPFLDREVIEFAFSLPPAVKMRLGSGKHILRETFGHLLPPLVMQRRKRGFEVPLLDLFLGPLHGLIDRLLAPQSIREAGLDEQKVKMHVEQLRSARPGPAQATIHALIVYMSWWEAHKTTLT